MGLVRIVQDLVLGVVDLVGLELVDDLELRNERFSGSGLKVL